MPVGIEHREPDTVLQVFDNWNRPQWVLSAGKEPRDGYEGNNIDDSRQHLVDCLDAILNSGTNTVYTIRSYADEVGEINSKTPFKASTTFMLGGKAVKTENGVTIIDRGGVGNTGANLQAQSLAARLDKLEQRNQELERQLFESKLESMQREFENKIAGLKKQEDKESLSDKLLALGQAAIEKPEVINNIFSGLQGIGRMILNRPAEATTQEPVAQIAGTNQQEQMATNNNLETELDPEIRAEEQALYDRQEEALEAIEKKIGIQKLTEALETLAKMNTVKLKSLLAMM